MQRYQARYVVVTWTGAFPPEGHDFVQRAAETGLRVEVVDAEALAGVQLEPDAVLLWSSGDGLPWGSTAWWHGRPQLPRVFVVEDDTDLRPPLADATVAQSASGAQIVAQVERAMQARETRRAVSGHDLFRAAFEAAPVPMLIAEPGGVGLCANRKLREALGYSDVELSALSIRALTHPDDWEADLRLFSELIEGRRHAHTLEKRYLRKDGSVLWALLHLGLTHTDEGQAPAILAVIDDLDAVREVRRAHRETEDLLQQVITATPAVFWALTPDWREVRFINPAWERVYGYTQQALRDNPALWIEAIHPEDRAATLTATQAHKGRHHEYEYRIVRPDGGVRWIRDTAFPVFDATGEVKLVAGFGEDVTHAKLEAERRVAAEAQLLRAQKLQSLGLLAGGVAHDFNNLLMVVAANGEMLAASDGMPSQQRAAVDELLSATRQAAELCTQLLAYAGQGRIAMGPVWLEATITELRRMLKLLLPRGCRLELQLEAALPPMFGDLSQVRQLVMNLVMNAGEATGGRGRVTVRSALEPLPTGLRECFVEEARRAEPMVVLHVEDDGCGIAPENLPLVFDPFFSTRSTGRGLGLAAVLGIVRGHRGALNVVSVPGKGTRFSLYFPTAQGATVPEAKPDPQAIAWRGAGSVLVVDDNAMVRSATQRLLETLGFSAVLAAGGEAALELVRGHSGKLVCALLDLSMPGMDGVATLRQLRAIAPDLPIVLTSGYNVEQLRSAAAVEHVHATLQKPYRREVVASVLRSLLESAPA